MRVTRWVVAASVCPSNLPMIGRPSDAQAPTLANGVPKIVKPHAVETGRCG